MTKMINLVKFPYLFIVNQRDDTFGPPAGHSHSRCAEVPRGDHYLRDDHGRLSRAEEATLALCGHRRGSPPQEPQLQIAGGTKAHEPGQSNPLITM